MVERTESVQNYFVGIDGSNESEDAFEVVISGLRRPQDKITAAHVHDTRKSELPYNMKPHYIKEVFSCKLMVLGDKGSYASDSFEGGKEVTTKSCLMALAKSHEATITVTGMHGRKGIKA